MINTKKTTQKGKAVTGLKGPQKANVRQRTNAPRATATTVAPPKGNKLPKGPAPNGTPTPPVTGPLGQTVYPVATKVPWILPYGLTRNLNVPEPPIELLDWYPGSFVSTHPTLGVNSHATLHYERAWKEQDVLHTIVKAGFHSVLDVAGNIPRASRVVDMLNRFDAKQKPASMNQLLYYSCNPVINGSDAVRNVRYDEFLSSRASLRARTDQKLLQRTSFAGQVDCLMLIHVLYYITRADLLESVIQTKGKTAWAVVHPFAKGEFGSFPGATWRRTGDMIRMAVVGNSFHYEHNDLAWLDDSSTYAGTGNASGWTLCWSKEAEGLTQHTYRFVAVKIDSIVTDCMAFEETLVIPKTVCKLMNMTTPVLGGFGLWTTTHHLGTVTIISSVYKAARRSVNMGKRPDETVYRQLMSRMRTEIEEICTTAEIDAEWFPKAFVFTVNLAFVASAVDYNASQAVIAPFLEQLSRMKFGEVVERPLAVTEKLTNVVLATTNWIGEAAEAVVPDMEYARDELITSEIRMNVTEVNQAAVVVMNDSSTVSDSGPPGEYPFKLMGDVELVQSEVNARVTATGKASRVNQKERDKLKESNLIDMRAGKIHSTEAEKSNMDFAATHSIKKFYHRTIAANPSHSRSHTPYCFSRRLGPPLMPNTKAESAIVSAQIHRLFDGNERLNYDQNEHLQDVWFQARALLPTTAEYQVLQNDNPLRSSEEWLTEQYGRRNDKAQVAKFMKEGIEAIRDGQPIIYDYEFFVKMESAITKGNTNKFRGIFVVHPTYSVTVNPTYHQLMKNMCKFFHPDHAGGLHTIISAGLTAPIVAKAMGGAIDRYGVGIIVEMDASSFEANQSLQHTDGVINNVYIPHGITAEALDSICKMKNVRVVRRFELDGTSRACFVREGGMGSGIGDVSLRNSLNTLMARVSLLLSVGMTVAQIIDDSFATILGDDNWIAIRKSAFSDKLTPGYVTEHFKVHHSWKMKCNIYTFDQHSKSEFCSMYLAQDAPLPNGDTDWFMSCKPGRILTKTLNVDPKCPMAPEVQLRGIIRGAGHFKSGWLLSRCLVLLDQNCKQVDKVRSSEINDWSMTYKYHADDIVLSSQYAIDSDCERYDLTPAEMHDALRDFDTAVKASNFPYGPIIIPETTSWDRIIDVDAPASTPDFQDDQRLDRSAPRISDVKHIPRSWYNKLDSGHIAIYPGDGGHRVAG